MLDCEIITFRAGIQWGCQLIMTAHISAPNVIGEDIPSTMSSVILQDKLRRELGYQNIIVTDAMDGCHHRVTPQPKRAPHIKAQIRCRLTRRCLSELT
ncbi:MAG: hypothetical protein J6Q22_18155 [Prevotella sp.]|nr:hypothetical protein [Prevotella sp.]